MQATTLTNPFKLPSYKYLDATTNREVVSQTSKAVHPQTGEVMETGARYVAMDMEQMAAFTGLPPMAVLSADVGATLCTCKELGKAHPSLHLLGFWPKSCIRPHHQVPLGKIHLSPASLNRKSDFVLCLSQQVSTPEDAWESCR